MKFPNKYLRNVKPYKLASHKIWAVSPKERAGILKLDWNEATVPPSPLVKKMIYELLEQPSFFNLYPTTLNDELLSLLSDYVGVPTSNLQYFNSSDSLHEYICKVFISVGDPVMILGPSYDNFRLTCQANGADVFWSNYNEDFSFDSEHFELDIQRIEPAMVYICNPNNPTGNVHSAKYIQSLLEKFPDTLFLIDEAYFEFSGVTVKSLVLKYDNILVSRTMSKAFALANFRIGYLIASKDNVQFINRIRNPKNLATIAQTAAIAVLKDTDYMWNYVHEVKNAQQIFNDFLRNHYSKIMMPIDSGGNFTMIYFNSREDKYNLMNYLADNNIFVRDCTQNSLVYNCFRITIGTIEQMHQVMDVINQYYGE